MFLVGQKEFSFAQNMSKTLYLVRHGEGEHNINVSPTTQINSSLPSLCLETDRGSRMTSI